MSDMGPGAGHPGRFFALQHVSAKLYGFADKNMLQIIDLARILFAQVFPLERKAR